MKKYSVRVMGSELQPGSVSGAWLGELLGLLSEGARRAIRLRVEGRSTASGSPPDWLSAAADFRFVGVRAGSIRLVLEAPTLAEACPARFGQAILFDSAAELGQAIGLELFEESSRSIVAGQLESDAYDDGLIEIVERFDAIVVGKVEAVELGRTAPTRIDAASISRAHELRRQTPADQRVIVTGKIETIQHSDRMFRLLMPDGNVIRGFLDNGDSAAATLARLFGRRARVSGTARFKPSGTLARLDADRIDVVGEGDEAFAVAPRPILGELGQGDLRRSPTTSRGIGSIIGQWPGDETDDEIRRALADLS
ncbi:MAG TPA: hypothetical protein VFD43_05750 [Planctomycetota bacterium]|nr:hypothetical protein [Planctomycetota bacterium]